MTIYEAYRKGIGILTNAGNEAPANDAGVLLCFAAQCDRAFLYAHGKKELEKFKLDSYFSTLESRAAGVPLQYLTGVQEFMSLPFEVGRGVFIPRQETELLVETVTDLCKKRTGTIKILDIGTGSGCIAVSLAYYLPQSFVTAVDKMPDAIAVASRNALRNGVADRVRFVKSDLFDELEAERFDVIVSNPPYIRTNDIQGLKEEVKCYEPLEALDGGMDGLFFYREIIKKAPAFLKDNGALAVETGYDQAADVETLMSGYFHTIKTYRDMAGIDRVVTGQLDTSL